MTEFDDLSHRVIGCAIEVHREMGPGLLESTYEQCLAHELRQHDIQVLVQQQLPVEYKGLKLECGYRIDLLVENQLIVELKSVAHLAPIHEAQLLTYNKTRTDQHRLTHEPQRHKAERWHQKVCALAPFVLFVSFVVN